MFIQQLEAKLADNEALRKSVEVNTADNARLTFNHVVNDHLQDMIDANFRFYKKITDDREFAAFFLEALFDRYRSRVQQAITNG